MWRMLQQIEPDDYILATGETHSVRQFVEECAKLVEIDLHWKGNGLKEIGTDKKTGKVMVRIDPKYYRPAEVDILCGDAGKARKKLGWKPQVKFKDLAKIMMEHDLEKEGVVLE